VSFHKIRSFFASNILTHLPRAQQSAPPIADREGSATGEGSDPGAFTARLQGLIGEKRSGAAPAALQGFMTKVVALDALLEELACGLGLESSAEEIGPLNRQEFTTLLQRIENELLPRELWPVYTAVLPRECDPEVFGRSLHLRPLPEDENTRFFSDLVGRRLTRFRVPPHHASLAWARRLMEEELSSQVELLDAGGMVLVDPLVSETQSTMSLDDCRRAFDLPDDPALGRGSTLAVLDTGIDLQHPAFREMHAEGRLLYHRVGGYGEENDRDPDRHGSHVAGIACGQGSSETRGMAPGVRLVMVRVFDPNELGASDEDVISGLRIALQQNADVICMSIGSSRGPESELSFLCSEIVRQDHALVVAAAGNGGPGSRIISPANGEHVLCVAAVDREGHVAAFSSRGRPGTADEEHFKPGCAAFGVGIVAPRAGTDDTVALTGTSMACPLVAGMAAALAGRWREKAVAFTSRDLAGELLGACLREGLCDDDGRPYAEGTGYNPDVGAGLPREMSDLLASTAPTPAATQETHAFAPGDRVRGLAPPAETFGVGEVLEVDGAGVSVFFEEEGVMEIVPAGELEPIDTESQRLKAGPHDTARLFDLRTKAHWIKLLTEIGLFSNAKVAPLPHQILSVDAFLRCKDPKRLLIADEVGLGKTVEAGLILKLLVQRGEIERILILTPAGLVLQWQAELARYDLLRDVEVFGHQLPLTMLCQFSRLVGSIDRLKRPDVLEEVSRWPDWDIVVVDEAHYLARDADQAPTQRYAALKEELLLKTKHLLLLTATPHSGKTDRFIALLDLLTDENLFHAEEIARRTHSDAGPVPLTPAERSVVENQMLLRRKADAVFQDGTPIFFARRTTQVPYTLSDEELAFRERLDDYFGRLHDTRLSLHSEQNRDTRARGLALGFVEIAYQKIADSSARAIERALENRLRKLQGQAPLPQVSLRASAPQTERPLPEDAAAEQRSEAMPKVSADASQPPAEDDVVSGEEEERNTARTPEDEFFRGEAGELKDLLDLVRKINRDSKAEHLIAAIKEAIKGMSRHDHDERAERTSPPPAPKFMIFVEYLATLSHVAALLQEEFGAHFPGERGCVAFIHGGMTGALKEESQERFRADPNVPFLISTSAGSEGLNLQCCRMLFNYDLPWNPLKVEQRIGRIHRYGSESTALIYNFVVDPDAETDPQKRGKIARSKAHISSRIRDRLLEKLGVIASDLVVDPSAQDELESHLKEMILGNSTDAEWDTLIAEALAAPVEPLKVADDKIDAMLEAAKRAMGDMPSVFGRSQRIDHKDLERRVGANPPEILKAFASAFLDWRGGRLEPMAKEGLFALTPLDTLQGLGPGTLHAKDCSNLVFEIQSGMRRDDIQVFGAGQHAFDAMIEHCTAPDFEGQVARIEVNAPEGWIAETEGVVFHFAMRRLKGTTPLENNLFTVVLDRDLQVLEGLSTHLRAAYARDLADEHCQVFDGIDFDAALARATALARELAGAGRDPDPSIVTTENLVSCALFRLSPQEDRDR